ncbi:hypothetical protein VNO77_22414 [Canavalia gladiata]|uniref:Uncharacterized protein n=1 Tax=Canavalia gladiata TaxID=3824 RepID=A0AAN9QAJ3_CANGL
MRLHLGVTHRSRNIQGTSIFFLAAICNSRTLEIKLINYLISMRLLSSSHKLRIRNITNRSGEEMYQFANIISKGKTKN